MAAQAAKGAKVTKRPGPPAAGLVMIFKLIEPAEQRWRSGQRFPPRRPRQARAGAKFDKGVMVERRNEQNQESRRVING